MLCFWIQDLRNELQREENERDREITGFYRDNCRAPELSTAEYRDREARGYQLGGEFFNFGTLKSTFKAEVRGTPL